MADPHRVRWTTGRGLSIPAARHVRVVLDGEQLVLRDVDGRSRQLGHVASFVSAHTRTFAELRSLRRWPADPADETLLELIPAGGVGRELQYEVTRIEASAGPAAVVLSDASGPVVALPLAALVPPGTSVNDLLDASGAAGLVRALGLTAEPGAPLAKAQRAAESRVLLRPLNRLLAVSRLVLTLAVASAVVAMIAIQSGADWPGWPHVLACLLVVAATVGLVRSQWQFRSLTGTALDSGDRAAYTVPATAPGTQLQFGPRDVVIVRPFEAEETWLGGPRTAGVTEVEIGTAHVHLRRGDGRVIAAFERTELAPTPEDVEALRDCCESAGIEVGAGSPGAEVGAAGPLPLRPFDERAGDLLSRRESGELGLTVPVWCGLAAALGLVGALGPGADAGVIGWLLVAGNVACLLAVVWGWVGLWRWRRRSGRVRGGS